MKPDTFTSFVFTIIALVLTTTAQAIPTDADWRYRHETSGLKDDTGTRGPVDFDALKRPFSNPIGQQVDSDTVSDVERVGHQIVPNARDTDNDGLSDYEELNTHGTSATESDTDLDGIDDSTEIYHTQTDPTNPDTDGDGLSDGEEVDTHATNPNDVDTDRDDCTDHEELNDSTDPLNPDTDDDGLTDCEEKNAHGTDPNNPDTDDDGFNDGDEVELTTDPLDNQAYPKGRFRGGCSSTGPSPTKWSTFFSVFLLLVIRKRESLQPFNGQSHFRQFWRKSC